MSVKAIIILCAQALLIQSAFSQCISRGNYGAGYGYGVPSVAGNACGAGLGYGSGIGIGTRIGYGAELDLGSGLGCGAGLEYGAGLGYNGFAIGAIPTSGGALPVSSSSAIAPTGLSVDSENGYEGVLSVAGELPFLSGVALQGAFPSGGAGVVNYSCGNGLTAIESIGSSAGYAPTAAVYGPGISSFAPGAAIGSGLSYGGLAGCGGVTGCGCGCDLY